VSSADEVDLTREVVNIVLISQCG